MSDRAELYNDVQDTISRDIRYEVYEGVIKAMAPPSFTHQDIAGEIFQQFKLFLNGKKCRAVVAPFNVDLTEFVESKKRTVVQPDVTIICDPAKLDKRKGTYYGPPALVVEVASPSTLEDDLGYKKLLYEKAGVPEYLFVVDYYTAYLFTLKNGIYQSQLYEADDPGAIAVPLTAFPELTIELKDEWFKFGE